MREMGPTHCESYQYPSLCTLNISIMERYDEDAVCDTPVVKTITRSGQLHKLKFTFEVGEKQPPSKSNELRKRRIQA